MALVYGGASLPCLSYKNYTHLCFSSGLLASQCRVYPLGGERALPFYSVPTDRAASATVATRHSLSTFGYTGARAAHVGTVHWAGKGETRAWMERGANREVMGVEEWMLAEPESRAAHREGRRSRILIDEDEYEWAQGPEKGSFVLSRCSFGRPSVRAAVYTPATPAKLFCKGQPASLVLNLEHVNSASMAEHLSTLDTVILSLIIFAHMSTDA